MRRPVWFLIAFLCADVHAAAVNMNDPRRAVGTDDGVRIDAELTSEFVSPGLPVAITYQIQNSSSHPIAVADRECEASYDADSRTITLSVGSEIPKGGQMPRVVFIRPREKRVLHASSSFSGPVVPRFVQIRVNVLRDVTAFLSVIERQQLDDALFDRWIDANEAIDLNVIPVRYRPAMLARSNDASQR